MPYGTVNAETRSLLADKPELLEKCEDPDGPWRVDVVISGALDESFNVTDRDIAEEVAQIIADSLAEHKDLDSGEDYEVDVYDDLPCPPEVVHSITGTRK